MHVPGSWSDRGGARPGAARIRPRYTPRELLLVLWSERAGMFLVFAAVFAVGATLALSLPKSYSARSSLLVAETADGPASSRGAVRTELEILSSIELKRRVLREVGLSTIDPALAAAWARSGSQRRREIEIGVLRAFASRLEIAPDEADRVVRLKYRATKPEAASRVLSTFVDQYVAYRREVFGSAPRRPAASAGRGDPETAYQALLKEHGLVDLEDEKEALSALYDEVLLSAFDIDRRLEEVRARLAVMSRRLGETPAETGVFRDLNLSASEKLVQLRMDRQDLLAQRSATAEDVAEIDARIANLEALISSGAASGPRELRVGANPVWQTLEMERIRLEAEAAALNARKAEIGRQMREVVERRTQLSGIEGQARELDLARGTAAGAPTAATVADPVKVAEPATIATEGKALRRATFAGSVLAALLASAGFGYWRVRRRRGFATAGSAGRTLGLPVLATAGVKP
jgi:uncharacterized protein involved in exopolysaccharide biosynthesis